MPIAVAAVQAKAGQRPAVEPLEMLAEPPRTEQARRVEHVPQRRTDADRMADHVGRVEGVILDRLDDRDQELAIPIIPAAPIGLELLDPRGQLLQLGP